MSSREKLINVAFMGHCSAFQFVGERFLIRPLTSNTSTRHSSTKKPSNRACELSKSVTEYRKAREGQTNLDDDETLAKYKNDGIDPGAPALPNGEDR